MTFAEKVQRAIGRAGVTVIGVAIGSISNKATWRVDHLPTATQADRDTAASVIAAFSETDPVVVSDEETTDATITSMNKDVLATVAWAIRLKDQAAWNALTTAQKKSTVQAAAADWRDIRIFIGKNL